MYVGNISAKTKTISNKLHTITKILNFGQFWCPIPDTFCARIVHFILDEANWSLQISSVHPLGQHINANLVNVMYISYTTTLLSHSRTNEYIIRTHLKLVILWYIGGIRSYSTRTSSIHPYGWYIHSELGYVRCSKYTTTIHIHERAQFHPQNRFFACIVWNICARESVSD